MERILASLYNVAEVDAAGLCLECGTCVGLCPNDNVRMEQDASSRYRIRVLDATRCESCPGICLQVCPGHSVDVDTLACQVFGSLPEDYLAGTSLATFFGYATDSVIRQRASSGGIVSGLLVHALASGRIGGAFLARSIPGSPFSLSFDLATDAKGVLDAAGSKYWPAPVGSRLGDILRRDGRYAFVGTPCQIQALRKAQSVYRRLNQKVEFCIGLFCGRRATVAGQEFLLRRLGLKSEDVAEFTYRQGEWPGHLAIRLKDERRVDVPREEQLPGFAGHLFPHHRCVLCHDSVAELADISVGDSLRLDGERRENEFSLVVARTQTGLSVLESAASAGALHLRATSTDTVIRSQKRPLMDKRRAAWARLALANAIPGLSAPQIRLSRPPEFRPTAGDYLRGLAILAESRLVMRWGFVSLLARVPLRWLRRWDTFEKMQNSQ